MTTSPYDLVIFDCDGVLIDSEPLASRTLAETLTEAGLPFTATEVLIAFTGKSESQIRDMLRAHGLVDLDPLFDAWQARLFTAFAQELRCMAGIEALLDQLPQQLCVASNSTRLRLERSLGRTPLWDRFAPHVYSGAEMPRPKPAPDLVDHCLARMQSAAARAVMIDDSATGIRAARAAGVRAIGFVAPGDPRPDRARLLRAAGAHDIAHGCAALAPLLLCAQAPDAPLEEGPQTCPE